jgi:hypothetical protein
VSKRKRYYAFAATVPFIFASTSLVSAYHPRTSEWCELIQHLAEAIALHSLNKVCAAGCL